MKTIHPVSVCLLHLLLGGAWFGEAATYTVTVTNENGAGSLRQAILDANANPGPDLIHFSIGSVGKTISPTNALPALTEPATLDGTTQPGFSGAPIVELNGASAGRGTDGLRLWGGGTTIRGLVINRFNGDGLEIATNGNNVVEGCYVGLGLDGVTVRANTLSGIYITNSANNVIGGLNATNRNYVSGNTQHGVHIGGPDATNNTMLGNVIGLDIAGADKGNGQDGVRLNAPNSIVGGTVPAARNVISGNNSDGIELINAGSTNNRIQGNFVGTDAAGTLDRGNNGVGILVNGAPANLLGGAAAGAGNLVSGNGNDGIQISGLTAAFNQVLGNTIGLSSTGAALGNTSDGVELASNARTNTIGGTAPGESNTIAFNSTDGLFAGTGTNNTIRGNSIHSNAGLGIDLGLNGVAANDAGDPDTGANHLQNFPILSAATNTASGLFVVGALNSRPSAGYTLDFYSNVQCDPTTNGEGQVWLAALAVTTGADSNAAFAVTLPAGTNGRFITATATDANGNTSEFSPCVRAESTLAALTFTVTNTNDSGAGSLRQAVLDNNFAVRSNRNTITFAIPNPGPHIIAPLSPFPTIIEPVAVYGFTQSGTVSNSLPQGNNAVWQIVLDGAAIPTAGTDGLRVEASGCLIQGLAITRFADNGIELVTNANCTVHGCLIGLGLDGSDQGNANSGIYLLNSAGNLIGGTTPDARNIISGQNSFHGIGLSGGFASNNVIQGNFIGTGLDGTGDLGNNGDGINLAGSPNNLIVGSVSAAGNVIAGNNGDGIEINGVGATGNVVLGNTIGLDATGTTALGNTQNGIHLTSNARSNSIGGTLAGEANRIAYNVNGDGIYVASGTNNTLRANAIYSNGDLGIDLGSNGKTANDTGDADTGANQLQNFPLVTNATLNVGSTFIGGTLNSRSNTAFTLDFFSSLLCDPSTNGEGQIYLGSTTVATGSDSNASFSISLPVTAVGRFITATATDPFGNTSEFGPCFRAASVLPPLTFTVVNTNDSGAGSLRQAILDNNATYFGSPNTIAFAIPGNGPHTIAPASVLPDITETVVIDGFTQTNATPNTLPDGNNAVLQIRLWGRSFTDGLRLRASGCAVRGLAILNWGNDGIDIANCDGNVIAGCFLGLDVDGTAKFNSGSSVSVAYSGGNRIGGTAPADRNAIIGVFLTSGSSNNVVQGNFIGCGLHGTNTVGFPSYGIILEDSTDNLIGGAVPGARNILSGHLGNAVHLRGTTPTRNVIAGNYIGADVTGLRRLGNGRGISIEAGSSNRIGGATAAERNVISGNGSDGVAVIAPASGNEMLGNWIGVDATGAGVLTNGGVGVFLTGHSNRVGGILAGEANVIANNTGGGVLINGVANTIRGNSIFNSVAQFVSVTALGINLGFDNVTPNDAGDADAGANQLQNFPVLTAATGTLSSVQIVGTLNSQPVTAYNLDFYSNPTCDPTGYGEGQTYLGSTSVVTDGSGNGSFNVTFPRPLAGRFVSATATDPAGNTSEFAACVAAVSTVPGATFTVTTTNDSGAGSLRQVILDANATVTAGNTIAFAIPGAGVRVIRPLTPLPAFIEPVTIDGFTQTNASANTLPTGNNANWLIELNGSGLTGGQQDGLRLSVAGTTVRGLRILRFNNDGLEVSAADCVVAGNLIASNGNAGVHLLGPAATVGGLAPADRNVISANASYGVYFEGTNATANQVLGNFIGTDASGTADGGGSGWGVVFWDASSNTIGGTSAGAGNVLAFHDDLAVFVQSGTNNAVRGNRIFSNGGLGIDLGFQGVAANDSGDGDTGANQLQNFPLITNATASVGSTQIRGTLNSRANTTFDLDFFSSVACHWSGHGQGEFYLGSTSVATDGGGNASFNVALPVAMQGNVLTATATDPAGNTSEFSPCFAPTIALPGLTYYVTNSADSGPGTFRQALLDSASTANSTPDQILFNLPGTGVRLISLLAALPDPKDPVFIDGYSQPGASANTSSNANDAAILVRLDGNALGFNATGLNFTNDGNTVRGISFTGFGVAAIALNSANNTIEGCWLGLTPAGLPGTNSGSGVAVYGAANQIGGTNLAARNVIAANEDYGIVLVGSSANSNVIQGNFIGVAPTLSGPLGNGREGILVEGAPGNLIGGTAPNAGNVIGGNQRNGVLLRGAGAANNRIEGNAIGTRFADDHLQLGNASNGVATQNNAHDNTIGGETEEAGNLIAFNRQYGVAITSGNQNGILDNLIFDNQIGPIHVAPGANNGVQPPVLTSAVQGSVEVVGEVHGPPNTECKVRVFARPSGPPGERPRPKKLGSFRVMTDANGVASFNETLDKNMPLNSEVYATTTCDNNSSEASARVALVFRDSVDLVLTKQGPTNAVVAGETVRYELVVENKGPANATNVKVEDFLPPGMRFVSASPTQGTCQHNNGTVSCDLGPLTEDSFATIFVYAEATRSGLIENNARATAVGQEDALPSNNEDHYRIYVSAPPTNVDVSVKFESDAAVPTVGDQMIETLTVQNQTNSATATDVVLEIGLPPGFTNASAASAQGVWNAVDGKIQIPLGTLAPGQKVAVVLTMTVSGPHFDATVVAGVKCTQHDRELRNNSDDLVMFINVPNPGIFQGPGGPTVTYPGGPGLELQESHDVNDPFSWDPVPPRDIFFNGNQSTYSPSNPNGPPTFFRVFAPGAALPQVDFFQTSETYEGFISYPLTDHGIFRFTFQGSSDPFYINVNVAGNHVLQDMIVPAAGTGQVHTIYYPIPLGMDGVPMTTVNFGFTVTASPTGQKPPANMRDVVANMQVALASGIQGQRLFPVGPGNLLGGQIQTGAKLDGNLFNREQGLNECVPAAIQNSLYFLRAKHGLNLPDHLITIQKLKEATAWGPDGAPLRPPDMPWLDPLAWFRQNGAYFAHTKQAYMEQQGLPIITLQTTDPGLAMIALDNQFDVEVAISGHMAWITQMYRLTDGRWMFFVTHDFLQGLPGGTITEPVIFDPQTGLLSGSAWMQNRQLLEFVIERPPL